MDMIYNNDDEGYFIFDFDFLNEYIGSNDSIIQDEVDRYIRSEFNDIPLNLIDFWKKHQNAFPKLSLPAKKILCIPASTCANERSFSRLRYFLREQRVNLSASTISSLFIYDSLAKSNVNLTP